MISCQSILLTWFKMTKFPLVAKFWIWDTLCNRLVETFRTEKSTQSATTDAAPINKSGPNIRSGKPSKINMYAKLCSRSISSQNFSLRLAKMRVSFRRNDFDVSIARCFRSFSLKEGKTCDFKTLSYRDSINDVQFDPSLSSHFYSPERSNMPTVGSKQRGSENVSADFMIGSDAVGLNI